MKLQQPTVLQSVDCTVWNACNIDMSCLFSTALSSVDYFVYAEGTFNPPFWLDYFVPAEGSTLLFGC